MAARQRGERNPARRAVAIRAAEVEVTRAGLADATGDLGGPTGT